MQGLQLLQRGACVASTQTALGAGADLTVQHLEDHLLLLLVTARIMLCAGIPCLT
jgi:hypothetical protein